jgi:hypothetical protein
VSGLHEEVDEGEDHSDEVGIVERLKKHDR